MEKESESCREFGDIITDRGTSSCSELRGGQEGTAYTKKAPPPSPTAPWAKGEKLYNEKICFGGSHLPTGRPER